MNITPEKWTGEAVGLMHIHRITYEALANRMGIRREYLSMILNGRRHPKDAETKVMTAINEMIKAD